MIKKYRLFYRSVYISRTNKAATMARHIKTTKKIQTKLSKEIISNLSSVFREAVDFRFGKHAEVIVGGNFKNNSVTASIKHDGVANPEVAQILRQSLDKIGLT